jgi:hypothetical protein
MKKGWVFVIGLMGLVLLLGCVSSETPRGDISAPTDNKVVSNTSNNENSAEASPKDSYNIGELATAKNGMQLQITRVARIPNCGDDYCLGLYAKLKNTGDDKESALFSGSVLLDDKGVQYEYGSFSTFASCPNRVEQTALYPGASREGFLCFDDWKEEPSQLKAIVDMGFIGSTKFVYLINPSQIETLEPKAELEITGVDASFTQGSYIGYGSISGAKYELKNTGETYLDDLTFDYNLMKRTLFIDSEKDRSLIVFGLEPGKTDDGSLGIYQSLDQGGEYTLDVTVKWKGKELAHATKTFTTS